MTDKPQCSDILLDVIVVKKEFREKAFSVKKNNFKTIEHMIRHGKKLLKLLNMPGFNGANIIKKE
jgi:hypothetical protein